MIPMPPAERQAQLLAAAGRYLAGGGLGLFVLPPELNLVVARGEGSHVWDVAGREYIDYHLGSGPALLGHAHPAVTAAVAAQLPKGTTYYFLNEPEIVLAQKLVEAIPCADAVHYVGSGTEATFYALRIARAFTGRNKVMKFEGAWHGMHDYGLWGTVPATASPYPRSRPDSVGVPPETGETVLVAPFNDADAGGRADRAPREGTRGRDRRAAAARAAAGAGVPRGAARRHAPARHRADLRRDRHRVPHRVGRRAAEVRRRARPRVLRQGGERRLSARGDRRQRGRAVGARRARAAARHRRVGDQHAERQSGLRGRRLRGARRARRARHLRAAGGGRAAAARGVRRRGHAPRLRRAGARRGRGVRHPLHRPAPAARLDGPADRRQGPWAPLGARAPEARTARESRTRSSTSRSCTATTTSRARSRSRTRRSRRCAPPRPPRDRP